MRIFNFTNARFMLACLSNIINILTEECKFYCHYAMFLILKLVRRLLMFCTYCLRNNFSSGRIRPLLILATVAFVIILIQILMFVPMNADLRVYICFTLCNLIPGSLDFELIWIREIHCSNFDGTTAYPDWEFFVLFLSFFSRNKLRQCLEIDLTCYKIYVVKLFMCVGLLEN